MRAGKRQQADEHVADAAVSFAKVIAVAGRAAVTHLCLFSPALHNLFVLAGSFSSFSTILNLLYGFIVISAQGPSI